MTIDYSDAKGNKGSLTLPVTLSAGSPAPTPGRLVVPAGQSAVWHESFAVFDPSKWIQAIADQTGIWRAAVQAPDSAINPGGNNLEYFTPAQLAYGANGLVITAKRSAKYAQYSWVSGVVCTHGLWSTQGLPTTVQWLQTAPDTSDGPWPANWHLEGGRELDCYEGGFTGYQWPVNETFHSAIQNPQGSLAAGSTTPLNSGLHVVRSDIEPGGNFTTWIDGVKVGSLAGAGTGGYTILIQVSMASAATSSWHTVTGAATPDGLQMRVAEMLVSR